jgi:hypothetical protein
MSNLRGVAVNDKQTESRYPVWPKFKRLVSSTITPASQLGPTKRLPLRVRLTLLVAGNL